MRVAYITAGAGGMYCGSCMHDNTLAAALRKQGRDVVLLPVFTPIRTDEPDVSEHRVYYGGINVYLQQKSSLFRWMPAFLDRWLDSPRLLRWAVRTPKAADELVGRITVSVLEGSRGAQKKELEKLLVALRTIRPAVVNFPNALFAGVAADVRKALQVPVFCNLSGEDLFLGTLKDPYRERSLALIGEAAKIVDGFVAANRYYASQAVEQFGVPHERMHVVPLGIHVDEFASLAPREVDPAAPFTIGFFARLCRDKGLHLLVEAFEILREEGRNCRLRAGGYLAAGDAEYLDELRARLRGKGLENDFEVQPNVDRQAKVDFFRTLDVLSVPTVYRESKGLYVLEAGAAGVPVVQPSHGCFPEMVETIGGGMLFEPGNPRELARALGRLMDEPELRRSLADRARKAVFESFSDAGMADRTWSLYQRFTAGQNGR